MARWLLCTHRWAGFVDTCPKLIFLPTPAAAGDLELDSKNASVALVGKGQPLEIIEGEGLQKYLDAIEVEGNVPEAMEVATDASEADNMSTS